MSSHDVVKTVAKKLKYYFEVKRLEDGFDLSDTYSPKIDPPPLKPRPTLNYDGLHDRPLKHYFSPACVRVGLTQLGQRSYNCYPREKNLQKCLKSHMSEYTYVPGKKILPARKVALQLMKDRSLPDCYYITGQEGNRPVSAYIAESPRKTQRKKCSKGWPVIKTVPASKVSPGEAQRLVNVATKLIAATETIDQIQTKPRRKSTGRQSAPNPFESSNARKSSRPSTAKFTYDIHGRKHRAYARPKSFDDSYLPSLRKNKSRRRSPSGKSKASTTSTSITTINSTSDSTDTTIDDSPISSARPPNPTPSSSHRQLIINSVPEPQKEEVVISESTQTSDSVGIQTERRLLEEYDHNEDEVKEGPWGEYQIYVRTGNRVGASTNADVKITLYGEKGRTKEIMLPDSKINKIKFQRGKEDLFAIAAHHVGKLRKVKIGHDRPDLSYAWYLESLCIFDMEEKRIYDIPCHDWLSGVDGDGRTYRDYLIDRERAFIEVTDGDVHVHPNNERLLHSTSEDESQKKEQPKSKTQVRREKDSKVVNTSKETPKKCSYYSDSNSDSSSSYSSSSSSSSRTSSSGSSSTGRVGQNSKKSKNTQPRQKVERKTKEDFYDEDVKKHVMFSFSKVDDASDSNEKDDDIDHRKEHKIEQEYLEGYKAGLKAAEAEKKKQETEIYEMREKRLKGSTIHEAASHGDLQRVRELLEFFPEMKNDKDERGRTALHIAAEKGQIEVVKWLATGSVNLNMETSTGYTPLHLSAFSGHVNCMMILSAMGASLGCKNLDNQTPLHIASMGGRYECVKWLVANTADITAKDNYGRTPRDIAEEYEHDEISTFLKSCEKELDDPKSNFSLMHNNQTKYKFDNLSTIEEDTKSYGGSTDAWKSEKERKRPLVKYGSIDDYSESEPSRHDVTEVMEKKKIYAEQHERMERTGTSFLDSIRQEVET